MALPMSEQTQGVSTQHGRVVDVVVDVGQVQGILDRLDDAIGQVSLMAFLEGQASMMFHNDIESRFEEEGDAKSGFWKPLVDATIDIRRQYGFGDGPINERTGELKAFMMQDFDMFAGAGWVAMDVPGTPDDPVTATKLKTAQQGSNNNPLGYGPTPARPVLAVSEMDVFRLVEMLENHIMLRALSGV